MSEAQAEGAVAVDDSVRRFMAGAPIPVPLARIDAELARLFRGAHAAFGGAVSRACLLTLIVRVNGEALGRAQRLVEELAPSVPTRAILLAIRRDGPPAPLAATIQARFHRTADGACVGSEAITVVASAADIALLSPVVRALVLPDLPTAALWLGATPDAESPLDRELRDTATRLVLDGDGATAAPERGAGLAALARFAFDRPSGHTAADLAWLRAAPVRALVASVFDAPTPAGEARRVTRVRIAHRPDRRATALMLVGWLADRLGWTEGRLSHSGEGIHYHGSTGAGAAGGAGSIALKKDARAADPVGSVELFSAAGRFAVTLQGPSAILETPLLAWKEPFDAPAERDLWGQALGPAARDASYAAALSWSASAAREA